MVTDPADANFSTDVEINIDKIGIKREESHTNQVKIDEETMVVMDYPGIEFFSEGLGLTDIASSVKTVARCIKQIVVGEEVYSRADMSLDEVTEWLEDLTTSQMEGFLKFFTTMPKLSHTVTQKNTRTGENFTVTLEGL